MVEKLIGLIVRAVERLTRPLVMVIDWLQEDFTLWTVMRRPREEPPGEQVGGRSEQMNRYFRVSPEPTDKLEACLTGWSAVALAVLTGVLFAVHLPEFAWLTGLGAVLVWLYALERTVGYEFDHRRSLPKPAPEDIDGYLRAGLDQAVGNALAGLDLTAGQVEATIVQALGLPDTDRTYASPPVVHGPVHDDKDLPVILGGGTPRYRAHNVLALCPTDHHLVIYRGRLDMINGKIGKAEFHEVYPRDVTVINVVDNAPDVTFHARNDDGTQVGTRVDKEKLRELTIGTGKGEDRFSVLLSPGPELDRFLAALRGVLKMHKTAHYPVHVLGPRPLPVIMEEEPETMPPPVTLAG